MYEQQDLFSFVDNYSIPKDKEICLTELFAGIGAQSKSLEILGIPFRHYAIAEWSIHSIRAYARIHNLIDDDKIEELTKGKNKEEMLDRINGVSRNYNEPMTQKQLNSLNIDEIKDIYACCIVENNFINIMTMKGVDLGVYKSNEYHIWTYSFPCQDLSLAGNLKGLQKGKGTRSGLLWEVERLLTERERESRATELVIVRKCPRTRITRFYQRLSSMVRLLDKLRIHKHMANTKCKTLWVATEQKKSFYGINIKSS